MKTQLNLESQINLAQAKKGKHLKSEGELIDLKN